MFIIYFRTQAVEVATAEGERIKQLGKAEAFAIEAVGRAEAQGMLLKANVFKNYEEAAVMALIMDALPKIAAEIVAPLSKTEEIVLLSGSGNVTAEVNRFVGQLPPAVQALTGVDLTKVLSKIPGAK